MRTYAILAAVISGSVAAKKCYSVDGQELSSRYQPCFPQSESSACCMLNGTQGTNQQNDLCLDSGLCQSTSGWYAGFLYINGCTDPTGKADGCAKICNFLGNQYSWSVLQCEPGKFCCRAASNTANCCNDTKSVISTSHIGSLLLPGSTAVLNTTFNFTSEAPQVANSTTSQNETCVSTTTAGLFEPSQCPTSHTAVVGGAVGGTLGMALVGALVALMLAIRSRTRYKSDMDMVSAALSTAELKHAEESSGFQKRLEGMERQRSIPPQYITSNLTLLSHGSGDALSSPEIDSYATPFEMPEATHGLSELDSGINNSTIELVGDARK